MKTIRFAALAALFGASGIFCSATAPTWTQTSYGYYNPNAPVEINYWVDAYDTDGDLVSLTTWGYDEEYNRWFQYGSTGNGSHRESAGYCTSYEGMGDGKIEIKDSTATYDYTTQFGM